MRLPALLGAACVALSIASVSAAAEPAVLKVAVFADGRVTVDGAATTADDLDARLSALKKDRGVVWYYRENATSEPTAAQDAAVKAVLSRVVRARLPIRLFINPDFSDVTNRTGRPGATP